MAGSVAVVSPPMLMSHFGYEVHSQGFSTNSCPGVVSFWKSRLKWRICAQIIRTVSGLGWPYSPSSLDEHTKWSGYMTLRSLMAVSLREPWLGGVSIWGQHATDDLL